MANGSESEFAASVETSGYGELLTLLREIDATLDSLNDQTSRTLGMADSILSIVASVASVASAISMEVKARKAATESMKQQEMIARRLENNFSSLSITLSKVNMVVVGLEDREDSLNKEFRESDVAADKAGDAVAKMGRQMQTADKAALGLKGSMGSMGHGITGSLSNMSYAAMAFSPMMNAIGEQGADGFLDSFQGSLEKAKTEGPGLIGEIGQAISGAVTLLVESAGSLMASLGGAITSTLPVLLEAAGNLFGGIVQSLGDIVVPLAESFGGVMQSFFEHVGTLVPALLEAALNFFTTIVSSLEQIVGPLLDALPTVVTAVVAALPAFASTLLSAATTLFMAIAEAVPGILTSLLAAVGDLVGRGVDYVAEKADDMLQAGKDLIGGLVDGIRDAAGRVLDAIGGVVSNAIDWAKSLLGIHSPSTVFKGIGGNLSQGFADGIASKAAVAAGAMKDLVDDVALAAKMPALDVSAGMAAAAGMMGGLGYARGFGGAASGAVTNYYIDGVDLSSSPAAMKAAEQLWGDVRRQMRIGVR